MLSSESFVVGQCTTVKVGNAEANVWFDCSCDDSIVNVSSAFTATPSLGVVATVATVAAALAAASSFLM